MLVFFSIISGLFLNWSAAIGAPNMAEIRNRFSSAGSGPYFRGYCGEHQSEYQDVTQLAGGDFGVGKSVVPLSDLHQPVKHFQVISIFLHEFRFVLMRKVDV